MLQYPNSHLSDHKEIKCERMRVRRVHRLIKPMPSTEECTRKENTKNATAAWFSGCQHTWKQLFTQQTQWIDRWQRNQWADHQKQPCNSCIPQRMMNGNFENSDHSPENTKLWVQNRNLANHGQNVARRHARLWESLNGMRLEPVSMRKPCTGAAPQLWKHQVANFSLATFLLRASASNYGRNQPMAAKKITYIFRNHATFDRR